MSRTGLDRHRGAARETRSSADQERNGLTRLGDAGVGDVEELAVPGHGLAVEQLGDQFNGLYQTTLPSGGLIVVEPHGGVFLGVWPAPTPSSKRPLESRLIEAASHSN
jgi:hypothetical protein